MFASASDKVNGQFCKPIHKNFLMCQLFCNCIHLMLPIHIYTKGANVERYLQDSRLSFEEFMGEPTRAEKLFRQVLSSFDQFSTDPGQRFHAYVDF